MIRIKNQTWKTKLGLSIVVMAMATAIVPTGGITPSLETITAEAAAKQYTTTDSLNMRSGASTKHKSITTIPKGKPVTFVSQEGSWYKVKYGSKTGYVNAKYLKSVQVKPVSIATPKQYTTTDSLNMRSGASTKHKSITTIPKGKPVTFVSQDGSWYKVKYGSKTGYVNAKYLKAVVVKPAPKATPKPVVKPAPKPIPKPIVTPTPSIKWMSQQQAISLLGKTLDTNNELVAYSRVLINVDFYNKSDAKAGMSVDSRSYFSSIDIKPGDFGQEEYDLYKDLLKKMDASILAFAETQLGVGTSTAKRMASDIKTFTAYSKKDDKVLKTYSGKTYELWQMGGLVMVEFKK